MNQECCNVYIPKNESATANSQWLLARSNVRKATLYNRPRAAADILASASPRRIIFSFKCLHLSQMMGRRILRCPQRLFSMSGSRCTSQIILCLLSQLEKFWKMVFYALVFGALHPISFLPINSRSSSSVNRHALPLPVSTTPRLSANLTMPDAGMLISGFVAAST